MDQLELFENLIEVQTHTFYNHTIKQLRPVDAKTYIITQCDQLGLRLFIDSYNVSVKNLSLEIILKAKKIILCPVIVGG